MKIAFVVFGALLLLGVYKFNYLSAQSNTNPVDDKISSEEIQSFICEDGTVGAFALITSKDINTEKSAILRIEDSRIKMTHIPSGSGEKYQNTSESLVFWEKGGKAFIQKEGSIIHRECELKSPSKASSLSEKLRFTKVKDSTQCSAKNGYWYKDKCWKDFEDTGISIADIDAVVSAQMEVIKHSTFTIGSQTYPLIAFLPLEKEKGMEIIAVYDAKNHYRTLIFPTGRQKIENGTTVTSTVLVFDGDALSGTLEKKSKREGTATIQFVDIDTLDIRISGKIPRNDEKDAYEFSFKGNKEILGAGNSQIEIRGNEAYLSGTLGTMTYVQIKNLIKNNPEVKTIVMTRISGSVNDAVNMHTGRLLHENRFSSKVLSDSDIASGAVDLFVAGRNRIVEKGAKIGVHSWCCVDELTAIEIPKDHPAHQYQLDYFTQLLGADAGPDFYFYTLEASPFDDVHYMTDVEIKKWGVATDFIDSH